MINVITMLLEFIFMTSFLSVLVLIVTMIELSIEDAIDEKTLKENIKELMSRNDITDGNEIIEFLNRNMIGYKRFCWIDE